MLALDSISFGNELHFKKKRVVEKQRRLLQQREQSDGAGADESDVSESRASESRASESKASLLRFDEVTKR